MDRRKDVEFIRLYGLSELSRTSWFLAVFVRNNNLQHEQIRSSFLSMMDGQTKAFCHQHDTPLIIAPAKDERVCCMKVNDEVQTNSEDCNLKEFLYVFAFAVLIFRGTTIAAATWSLAPLENVPIGLIGTCTYFFFVFEPPSWNRHVNRTGPSPLKLTMVGMIGHSLFSKRKTTS